MGIISSFFDSIYSLGATAILPICMFVIALIFRVKFSIALKSSIRVGIGIWGLSEMITIACTYIQPLSDGLVANIGLTKTIIDGGVGVEILAAFNFKYASLMIPAGILLNVVLLMLKFTKTLDVDVWNFWSWLLTAQFVYMLTGSYLAAWVGFFITGAVSLKLGDIQAPKMQEVYGIEGISFPHPCSTWYAIPAPFFNKLFNMIGLDKIKADPETIQDKLGAVGDTTVIGAAVGFVMGLLGGFSVGESIKYGVIFAGIIMLFPTVIGFLVEGLVPISNAARSFLQKRFGDREFYIGLDCAIGVGQPANVVANAIAIPFFVVLTLFLPGVGILPAAGVAVGLGFALASAMPYFDNNIVKGVIYALILMIPTLYMETWIAPLLTDAYVQAGGTVADGSLICCSTSGYMWSNFIAWITHFFTGA